jgi:hypothetical protein
MTLDEELAELGVVVGGAPSPNPVAKVAPKADVSLVTAETRHPLADQWAIWKPRFAEAMDMSFDSMEDLERLVLQGRLQFWPGKDCALITEVHTYPGGERVVQAKWAAGDLAELAALSPGVEAFGRAHGCTTALIEGRSGWVKQLKALGYQPWSVTLKKKL